MSRTPGILFDEERYLEENSVGDERVDGFRVQTIIKFN